MPKESKSLRRQKTKEHPSSWSAPNNSVGKRFRIAGHESFPCRYTWLPKVVRGLERDRQLFKDEDSAMVELGLGKNMVRSARFWAQAARLVGSGGSDITKMGKALLGDRKGLDQFLEDIRTLWLIHWNLSTNTQNPLLAWDLLLNRWQEPELAPSKVIKMLQREASLQGERISESTVAQHFETFLHTYLPTRGKKSEVTEDNLDCPLVELELLMKIGESTNSEGERESIFAFRRESKPEITPELFLYCLCDFWQNRHSEGRTLSFRELAHGHGSPGQIFKLPEDDIRTRLEFLEDQTEGVLTFAESAHSQQVQKKREMDSTSLLAGIYRT